MNISLPLTMAEEIKKEVTEGKFATVSEFFRDLVRNWQEERFVREIKQSEKEIRAGNFVRLKSLKDLR